MIFWADKDAKKFHIWETRDWDRFLSRCEHWSSQKSDFCCYVVLTYITCLCWHRSQVDVPVSSRQWSFINEIMRNDATSEEKLPMNRCWDRNWWTLTRLNTKALVIASCHTCRSPSLKWPMALCESTEVMTSHRKWPPTHLVFCLLMSFSVRFALL